MRSYINELKYVPDDFSGITDNQLECWKKELYAIKQKHRREMDNIDTELLGIKEELRKRKIKTLEELNLPGDCIKG